MFYAYWYLGINLAELLVTGQDRAEQGGHGGPSAAHAGQ
jgi:hypothetical protein